MTRIVLTLALLALACRPAASSDTVVAVTSDYSVSGSVSTVGVIPPWGVDQGVASVHSDAVARERGGLIYVVNKLYADNIQVLDPASGFSTVRQFSVGPGTNPQDIAFVSDTRAYVSRYESTHVVEVDPTTGTVTDSVDLSALADADGLPEMSGMAVSNGYVLVAVQRIDRDVYWTPVPPSYLAVIDPDTNTLVDTDPAEPGVQSIELSATNPYGELHVDPATGHLIVPLSGHWGVLDGGVEVIDPSTFSSLGFLTTEAQLQGDINDIALGTAERAHAMISVTSPAWESFVVAWNRASGALIGDVYRPGGWNIADVEVHDGTGQLFVSDRSYTDPGVRVFDAATGAEQTAGALFVGLPPHDLVVLGSDVTGVADAGGASLRVWPNPSAGPVRLEVDATVRAGTPIDIYDVAGRHVARLSIERGATGVRWDGRDAAGRRVSSGVYFARAAGTASLTKVVVVR
ncbi:MAG: hypothetical protein GF405_03730 [Candidatus Eisenbacteria bacterium]|nr:hypothetical protein [Candidatus Eisenbacteria bacterium]